jgi:hypothetical protein
MQQVKVKEPNRSPKAPSGDGRSETRRRVKIKDPNSHVQFDKVQVTGHLVAKRSNGLGADITIDTWDCVTASGTFSAPTNVVTQCYLEDEHTGTKYYANTINNNNPGPGMWNATNFPTGMPSSLYDLYAKGDDGSSNMMGPMDCF